MRWLTSVFGPDYAVDWSAKADASELRVQSSRAAAERQRERDDEERMLGLVCGLTSCDLAEWMQRITAQGFTDRMRVIDWLRHAHGFPFATASWFERIHANGGRTLHGSKPPLLSQPEPQPCWPQPDPPPSRPGSTDSPAAPVATPPTPWPLYRPPRRHAERLVKWLAEQNHRTGEVLAREVQAAYGAMCEAIGWQPAAWNRVSPRFRELIGDSKHYKTFVVDGQRHRWCVIALPARQLQLTTDSPAVTRTDRTDGAAAA